MDKAGSYSVKITDVLGCEGKDTIQINESNEKISLNFVIATLLPNNENIYAVNISNPHPERIKWIIPEKVNIIEQNNEWLQMRFPENGDYLIGITGYQGKCEKTVYKTVQVVDREEIELSAGESPFLLDFTVAPNPNNGAFSVIVSLREATDFSLILYSEQGKIADRKDFKNEMYVNTLFNPDNMHAGAYILQLISKQTQSTVKILVK